ncbi:MAG: ammonia-forming cytochrome c nitrite reductase subunit c552 [Bdellovibrionaceae bacterium]|nr:ammonia-forming cytochrome c nitrite reductase subunit c552 [Pseudobdellovibrionaceae bacterium]NUM56985.1 ammonia-forming cytochrome c nitrite reductase subunit c552 [Pseudobdellovibrionaceae bacterium]
MKGINNKLLLAAGIFLGTLVIAAVVVNIFERKQEGKNPFYRVVEITDDTEDPAIWGKNFPHQYDSYLKTADMVRTKYGGSEAVPHIPTEKDPRGVVSQQKLDEDPRLKTMWMGYAFSADFREERGHAYMLADQILTERQNVVKQPGACLNCHASTYNLMKNLGAGDIHKGFYEMNKIPYKEVVQKVKHPVSCIDCHDSQTMALRITRPAFIEGMKAFKLRQGIKEYDINKMATRQEMRSFVCGQCHVEYYFKGPDKQLTFPWHNGLKADQILSYYQENKHKDWVHKETSAPVLKAQHPEFEMFNQGTHAKAGVSCVDCHMPFQRVGAMKVTDHHVRSPLLNINRACQTCHNVPEKDLKDRVETIQDRHMQLRNVAFDALVDYINNLKEYKDEDTEKTGNKKLIEARDFQRQAQFLFDFVEAENSSGFHAPQEAARILGLSIDNVRKGQKKLQEVKDENKKGKPVENK